MAGSGPTGPSCAGRGGQGTTRPCSRRRSGGRCSGCSCAAVSSTTIKPRACSGDRAFARRLTRYCARNPIALERLTYDAGLDQVSYRSDKTAGPTAGTATVDPLEFLARVVTHIPNPGQVMQRYDGWYASRTRGARRRRERAVAGPAEAGTVIEPVAWSLRAARLDRPPLMG